MYLLFAAGAILLLLPLLVLARTGRPRKHGLTNPPPGPWQLPVIGSLHHLVGALPHRAMRDLAVRHGPLMLLRMGELPVVVASSAEAAREVMKTHDVAFATRPRTHTMATLASDSFGIVLAPHGEHWRQMRKLCVNELLSARQVRSFRGSREAEAASLVESLASASLTSEAPVNLSSLITTYVVDSVVRAVVGDRIGNRDAFLEGMHEGLKVAVGFSLPDLFPSSRLARALSGTARRAEAVVRKMVRLMDHVIAEKRARESLSAAGAGGEDQDLLDVLLRIHADGGPLDMGTIGAVIRDLFTAGTESSSATIQWAMAELMRSPEALRRAQAEVRGALAGQSRVREEDLLKLPYLQLVIKETLRLHAPLPMLIPRECREPCRVLGYDVPHGAMVLVNAWAIGRDTATWGPDAEDFRPERFEEAGDAVDFRGADFQFVPFGAGRRMCPGISMGLVTMDLALASLLFHFDWELPGGASELDMEEALGITASRKTDLWLHATVRVPATERS